MDHHEPGEGGHENFGGLVISGEVLAAIAVTAAKDVDGVSALAPHPAALFSPRALRQTGDLRYVKITDSGAEISLALALRVKSEAKAAQVASEVQRAVKNAVQGMTGKTVAQVHIQIAGADF